MPVPFIDLTRLSSEIAAAVEQDWHQCLQRCEFVGGPRVARLETELAQVLGAPHALTCANGTDALIIALQALGVRRGHNVALPNLTFWATYEAIAQLGATPVLLDIDPTDGQLDVDQLRRAHAEIGLDAVLAVHLYGWASHRLTELRQFCRDHGLPLLEDGAQAFGVLLDGQPLLGPATAGTVSFYPAKVVGGAMDGGAITFAHPEALQLARSLCNHGRADHYSYAHVGWNSRMGGLQAAYLLRTLEKLPQILASRRRATDWYRQRFAGHPTIRVMAPPAGITENGYLNVAHVHGKTGEQLSVALKAAGIGCARTYPEPLHTQPPAAPAIVFGDMVHSRQFCASVINLPVFYAMTDAELQASADALEQAAA